MIVERDLKGVLECMYIYIHCYNQAVCWFLFAEVLNVRIIYKQEKYVKKKNPFFFFCFLSTDVHWQCGDIDKPLQTSTHLYSRESGRVQKPKLLWTQSAHVSTVQKFQFSFCPETDGASFLSHQQVCVDESKQSKNHTTAPPKWILYEFILVLKRSQEEFTRSVSHV